MVDGSSPLDSGPFGLSRTVCQQLQRVRARSFLGNVVPRWVPRAAAGHPRRRGDSISRGASGPGGGGLPWRLVPGRAGGGGSEAERPRPWASVRAAWSRLCPREDASGAAADPIPYSARPAVHHGLHPESPHRGRGGHRHPGELGLSLPPRNPVSGRGGQGRRGWAHDPPRRVGWGLCSARGPSCSFPAWSSTRPPSGPRGVGRYGADCLVPAG